VPKFESLTRISLRVFAALLGVGLLGYLVFAGVVWKQVHAVGLGLARKIRDFRNTEGLAMVQIRCLVGFETKNEAFA
jgi:hypothetical protein